MPQLCVYNTGVHRCKQVVLEVIPSLLSSLLSSLLLPQAGDLRGAATLEALEHLYNQGLYTLGTVLVDYRGFRVICQSIIPGGWR